MKIVNKFILCIALLILSVISFSIKSTAQITSKSQLPINLQNGLVAFYPFNGNAGDSSGNGNHGTVIGDVVSNVTDRNGFANSSFFFPGDIYSSDFLSYIKVPISSSLAVRNEITISVWIFMDGGYGTPTVLSTRHRFDYGDFYYRGSYSMQVQGSSNVSRNLEASIGGPTGSTGFCCGGSNGINVNSLSWQHVSFTADSTGKSRLYLNGVLVKEKMGSPFVNTNYESDLMIGRFTESSFDKWGGKLDDLMVYNRALSSKEISQLYTGNFCPVGQEISFNPLQDTTRVCGNSTSFDVGAGYTSYAWNTGAKTQSISPIQIGFYKVTVTNSNGCTASDSTYLSLVKAKIIQRDTTICKGSSIKLNVDSTMIGISNSLLPDSLRNGLVGYYPFNGNANDESGNGNNGSVGGVNFISDRFSQLNAAYDFNGSGGIGLSRNPISGSQDFTISSWIKTSNQSTSKGIIGWGYNLPGAGAYFFIDNFNKLKFNSGSINGPQSTEEITDGKWHFVAVSNKNGLIQLFLDGYPTGLPVQMNLNLGGPFQFIGSGIIDGGYKNFIGSIDDVCVWNKQLSSSEIGSIYSNQKLVSWSTGAKTNSITVSPTQTTKYYLTVSDGITSCQDSVTVNVFDPLTYNPLQDTLMVCADSVILDAGTGFVSYKWSNDSSSQRIKVSVDGKYKLSVNDLSGCTLTDSSYIEFANVKILQQDTTIILGDSLELTSNVKQVRASHALFNPGTPNPWSFPGSLNGGYIPLGTFGPQNKFSVSMWVKPEAVQTSGISILLDCSHGGSSNWVLQTLNSGATWTWGSVEFSLASNKWQHLLMTYDNGVKKVFIDGKLISTLNQPISYVGNPNLYLGNWPEGARRFFGSVDELYVTNDILYTENFIPQQEYNTALPNSLGLWHFNEGSGSITLNSATVQNSNINSWSWINRGSIDSISTSIRWSTNDTSNTIKVKPLTSTSYTLTKTKGAFVCSDTINVSVINGFSYEVFPDTIRVFKDSVILDAGSGYNRYSWSDNSSSQTINVKKSGVYKVYVTNSSGQMAADQTYVNIIDANIIQNDLTICKTDSVTLSLDTTFFISDTTIKSRVDSSNRSEKFSSSFKNTGNFNSPWGSVHHDYMGNIIVSGSYTGAINIDGNTTNSYGGTDFFVKKYDSKGNIKWMIDGGSSGSQDFIGTGWSKGIATDKNGNVYFAGRYNQTLTIRGTGGTSFTGTYVPTSNVNHNDGFVIKLDSTGKVVWGVTINGASNDGFDAVTVDPNGNIICLGGLNGCCPSSFVANINGPVNAVTVQGIGYGTGLLVKLSPTGEILWNCRMGNRDVSFGNAVTDADGNIYFTGSQRSWSNGIAGTLVDGSGASSSVLNPGIGLGFLIKLNASGVRQYAIPIGNNGIGEGTSTWVNGINIKDNRNIYITGSYAGDLMVFNSTNTSNLTLPASSSYAGFIAKYSKEGIPLTVKQVKKSALGETNLTEIETDSSYVAVTGYFTGANAGLNDGTYILFDESLNQIKSKDFGGSLDEYAKGLTISNGQVFVTGNYDASTKFDGATKAGIGSYLWVADTLYSNEKISYRYKWSSGDTSASIKVKIDSTRKYFVEITDGVRTSIDSVTVNVFDPLTYNPLEDTIKACGKDINLDAGSNAISFKWNDSSTNQILTANKNGFYKVTVNAGLSCEASDSTYLSLVYAKILQKDTTICKGTSITLSVDSTMNAISNSSLPFNLRNGLVAYYPFNGNANDESGNGYNGVVNGANLTTDRFGNQSKAYQFFSDPQNITIPNLHQNNISAYTVLGWFKKSSSSLNQDGTIFSGSNPFNTPAGFRLNVGSINRMQWSVEGGQNTNGILQNKPGDNSNYSDDKWHSFAAVFNSPPGLISSNSFQVFIDDTIVQTISYQENWPPGSGFSLGFNVYAPVDNGTLPFVIGNWVGNGGIFRGAIDDISVYHKALSPKEIKDINSSSQSISWSNGDSTNLITVAPTQTTKYYVTVSDGITSCQDSVTVNVFDPLTYNPLQDTIRACGKNINIDGGSNAISYKWNDSSTNQILTANKSGFYKVTVNEGLSCEASDSAYLSLVNAKIIQRDTTICKGKSITLSIDSTMNGSSNSSLPANLRNGLVAYYPFKGNANDESGNGNQLIQQGNPIYIENGLNKYVNLPTGNDYFLTPQSSWSLINNFPTGTVSFWIKLDLKYVSNHYFGIGNSIMTKVKHGVGEDLFFGIQDGTTKLRMQVSGVLPSGSESNVFGNTSLDLNQWYHVLGLWDGQKHKLYLNGNLDAEIINSSGIADRPNPDYFSIGSILFGGSNDSPINGSSGLPSGIYGSIANLRIYNRALLPSEVSQLASNSNSTLWSTGSFSNSITVSPTQTTKYYVTVSDGITTCQDSVTVNVISVDTSLTVLDPPTVCTNSGSVRLQAGSASSYTWLKDGIVIPGATSSLFTATQTGAYQVVVSNTNGCSDSSRIVNITLTPPSVAGTVSGAATACTGTNSTVLTLSGNTGAIQWQSSVNNTNFTNINGASGQTYTATNLTATTYYRAVVTSGGCTAATTASATITVNPASVAGTVSGAATVCTGTNSTVLTLSGNAGAIQWQSSVNNTNFTNINGATGQTYTASNLTATTYYRAVVTSGVCAAATTASATITVNPASVAGTVSGAATVCTGTNNTVLTLSGNTGAIQWQSSANNVNFTNINGATGQTYTATNLTATTYYRAVVTSGVCSAATSASATITVNPASVAGTVSGASTVCTGTNSTVLTLSGNTGAIQWQSSVNNTNFTNINGASGQTYTATNLTATTYFRAVVTSGVCTAASTASTTITVNPTSVAGTVSGAATVCTGTNSTTLTLSGNIGTIQWQSSSTNVNFTNINGATGQTYTATNLTATTYYRAVVTSGVCPGATTASATITVSPASVGGTVSGAATVCTGTNSTVLTLSGNTGTIQWQSSSNNRNFANINGATGQKYTATNLTATTYFRAVVTSGVCAAATTASVTITVNPASVAGSVSGDATVCAVTNSTVLTLSGNTGTIQWQSSSNNTNFTNINGATAQTYTATNLTATTYYRAVVTSGVCTAANTAIATITVNPASVAGTISGAATICSGTNSTTLTLSGNTGNIQWQSSTDNSTFININGASSQSYTASNLISNTYFRAIVTSGVCTADTSASTSITVSPLPSASITVNGSRCGSGSVLLGASTNSGLVADWYSNPSGGSILLGGAGTSSFNTPSITGTTTYYVGSRDTITGCVSSSRTAVIATINPLPILSTAGIVSPLCFSTVNQSTTLPYLSSNSPVSYSIDWSNAANQSGLLDQSTTAFVFAAGAGTVTGIAIQGNVAAGTYAGVMSIAASNGCVNTSNISITINALPAVPVISAASNNLCIGSSLVLSTNGSANLQWYRNNVAIANATSSTLTVTQAGDYKVLSTSTAGCVRSSLVSSITSSAVPIAGFSVSKSNQCLKDNSFEFINESKLDTGKLIYSWTFGDGDTSVLSSPIKSFKTAGIYNVTLVVKSGSGCESRISNSVTVYEQPIEPDVESVDSTLCTGRTLLLTTNGDQFLQWYKDSVLLVGSTSSSLLVSKGGKYRVENRDNNGCLSESVLKFIVENPIPVAGFALNNAVQCFDENRVITTNSSKISSGLMSYEWSFGDSTYSSALNPIHSYKKPGIYRVWLKVSGLGGCSDSVNKLVTIKDLPIKPNVNVVGNTVLCEGGRVYLIADDQFKYQWYRNGFSIVADTSKVLNAVVGGIYQVRGYSSQGCYSGLSDALNVVVGASPSVPEVKDLMYCINGASKPLTAQGSAGNALLWYTPLTGDTAKLIAPVPSTSRVGTYDFYVSQRSAEGCEGEKVKLVVRVGSIVKKPEIKWDGGLLSTDAGYESYSWLADNKLVETNALGIHKPKIGGSYRVKVSNVFGCVDSSAVYVLVVTGVSNATVDNRMKMKVYPNPSQSKVWIDIGERPLKEVMLRLLDNNGRVVYQTKTKQQTTLINWSGMVSGTYMVEAVIGNIRKTMRVVKE